MYGKKGKRFPPHQATTDASFKRDEFETGVHGDGLAEKSSGPAYYSS